MIIFCLGKTGFIQLQKITKHISVYADFFFISWLDVLLKFYFCTYLLVPLLQIHVHIKRHLMEELPETNSGIAQWCKDMFVAKVQGY